MQSEPVRPMPIRPLPMQSMTNPPHANAPLAEHHIIAETRRHCRSCREDICEKYACDTVKQVKLPREIVWITWLIVINLAKSKI